jgi:preprotein translocase subunit SecE
MDGSQDQSPKKTRLADFIREVKVESSKVTWPTRKETAITTAMVFAMSVAAAVFFFLADHIIAFAVRNVLGLGA